MLTSTEVSNFYTSLGQKVLNKYLIGTRNFAKAEVENKPIKEDKSEEKIKY